MSYEDDTAILEKVELPPNGKYWAMITVIRDKDEAAIQAAFLGSAKEHGQTTLNHKTGESHLVVSQDMDSPAFVRATILKGVSEWNLTGKDGAVLPIDIDSVFNLTRLHRNLLFKRIQELNAPPDDEEKKGSASASTS